MITASLMERCFPTKGLNPQKYNLVRHRAELVHALNTWLPKYHIDTPLRVRAFLACCGIETDYFRTTTEYASGAAYEGRRDLGNTRKGDGRRYKGSGIIQVTGRANFYRVMVRFVKKLTGVDYSNDPARANAEARRLGVNFLDSPELLRTDISIAVEAACIFWDETGLNAYADAQQIKQLNGIVNRGSPHKTPLYWGKRKALYDLLTRMVPDSFTFEEVENNDPAYSAVSTTPTPEVQPLNLDKAQAGFDKAQATLQSPSLRGVVSRAAIRLGSGLAAIWSTTGGKVALILTGIVIAATLIGAAYAYRKQLLLGYQIAKATVKKALGGLF